MSKRVRIMAAILFPCAAAMIYIFRDSVTEASHLLPECSIHKLTGLWCTGCGNTRSVNALLHGQLWRAVRYNPTIPFLGFMVLLLYAETVIGIWNDRVKLFPRKKWLWWTVLGMFLVFFIVRNFFDILAPPF